MFAQLGASSARCGRQKRQGRGGNNVAQGGLAVLCVEGSSLLRCAVGAYC